MRKKSGIRFAVKKRKLTLRKVLEAIMFAFVCTILIIGMALVAIHYFGYHT